ncbi:MAG: DEAD/DEAH box helicase [Spirochaetes bacterium]|nr:DEAD/DEAH box helicase [Spirochaetota bacterium]MBU0954432.1 DEAD/DEAH box helicase [Spirochaetota bacterium]
MNLSAFAQFGLSEPVLQALERKGFEEPTPIQSLAIPRMLQPGANLLARARTGTGKTAAFGLPLVNMLATPGEKVRALILVPTRELAIQVADEISSFAGGGFPRIATVYGGASMGEQLRRLSRGVDIVVGTPGRVIDHIQRKTLDLGGLEWLVLDEADEMLDMGFVEDIEYVLKEANPQRRVLLFSATMPKVIQIIARKYLGDFEIVEDNTNPVQAGLTDQIWLEVRLRDKLEALCRIVDSEDEFYGLVFCHTKVETDSVARALSERGYAAEALHGDVSQDMRERILGRFRERKSLILVATDVAARGIDVERLTHVVNFNLPFDPESYTHRIGRTGRAGHKGTAITFVTPEEYRRLFALKKASGDGLRKGAVPTIGAVIQAKRSRILLRTAEAARDVLGLDLPLPGKELDEEDAVASPADPDVGLAEGSEDEAMPDTDLAPVAAAALPGPNLEEDALAAVVAASIDHSTPRPPLAPLEGKAARHTKAFYDLADEILTALSPRDAVAALAAAAFSGDLDPRKYGEVREVSVDSAGTARLYIGLGKRDGVWPRDIAEAVKKLTGLPDRMVDLIEVLENFSFATVPFEAAEKAIQEARRQRGAPFVKIAVPKGNGPPRKGPYGGRSDRSDRPQGGRTPGSKPPYRPGPKKPYRS